MNCAKIIYKYIDYNGFWQLCPFRIHGTFISYKLLNEHAFAKYFDYCPKSHKCKYSNFVEEKVQSSSFIAEFSREIAFKETLSIHRRVPTTESFSEKSYENAVENILRA